MDSAQNDVQKLTADTKQKVEQVSQQVVADIKAIPPAVWGVCIGLSVLLSIILHIITKKKEDSVITAGSFVFGLFTGLLAVFLRETPQDKQFVYMLVALSVVRIFFDISAISTLVLALCPFVVNVTASELKQRKLLPQ